MWRFYCDCCGKEIKNKEGVSKIKIEKRQLFGDSVPFLDIPNVANADVCDCCVDNVMAILGKGCEIEE